MKQISFLFSLLVVLFLLGCNTVEPQSKKVKKTYFTGGQISSEFIMSDSTGQNGLLKRYGYGGKLTSTVTIHHGVKDGIETGYDPKGRVIWHYTYINGLQEGNQYAYYPNGDVMISYHFIKGIKDGIARTYNIDGTINKQVTYKHGKIVR